MKNGDPLSATGLPVEDRQASKIPDKSACPEVSG